MRSRREDSSSVSLKTGMPVAVARTSAIGSAVDLSDDVHVAGLPLLLALGLRRQQLLLLVAEKAASKSWESMADSLSRRTPAIFSSNSRRSGGAVIRRMRIRDPASSMRSIALSGRNRSEMYRSARVGGLDQCLVRDGDPVVRLVAVAPGP